MNKNGRPKLALDENLIFNMASKGCTDADIASVLSNVEGRKVSVEVLLQRRGHIIEQGRASMRRKLHELQHELAGSKNPIMLIWLGKQHLGQADKVESNTKQLLTVQSADIWKSAFGTLPAKKPAKGVSVGVN